MTDENKRPHRLTSGELSGVRGGIPYEKPDLIALEAASRDCNTGILCKTGGGASDCNMGISCTSGTIEEPE
jgi:hypothetical protein